jgi:hypothetical protein
MAGSRSTRSPRAPGCIRATCRPTRPVEAPISRTCRAPGEAAAKGKQQAIQEAAAVKAQALQAKKLAQQMGGVNGFAPKGAAAAPATIAKPAANGVGAKPAAAAVKHK